MPTAPSPHRRLHAPAATAPWLLIAGLLLGAGCGQTSPASSPARMASAADDDDSFRLFPSAPDFRLSPEAAAILRRPADPKPGSVRSAPLIASFPRSSSSGAARWSTTAKPAFRTADRLDGGATTIR